MKRFGFTIGLLLMVLAALQGRQSQGKSSLEDQIQSELVFWRKPGRIGSAACSNCHSPDGIELAAFNFSDIDIARRTRPHLDRADVPHIVNLIHLVRKKYGFSKLLDPMKDFPLQPGGAPLPGNSPVERDEAFANQLPAFLPQTFAIEVNSLKDAQKVRDEILAINLWKFPIGIPFNRLSEDAFHGNEHATFAHWISDVPQKRTMAEPAFYTKSDTYLKNSSYENLIPLMDSFQRDDLKFTGPISLLSHRKFESLLVYQHFLRTRFAFTNTKIPVLFPYPTKRIIPNPFWQVGEFSVHIDGVTSDDIVMPPDLLSKKAGGPSIDDQFKAMRAPWLWLGWMCDQGLDLTGLTPSIQDGVYLSDALYDLGPYTTHSAFFTVRRVLSLAYLPGTWNRVRSKQQLRLGVMAHTRLGKHIELEPKDPQARSRYRTFMCNSYRALMYLYKDQLERSREVWLPDQGKQETRTMLAYLHHTQPNSTAKDDELAKQVFVAIDDAKAFYR